jgi:raffinose/stachyose/melibiose transport system permease protein
MIPLEGIIVPLYFTMRSTPFASTVVALIIAHAGLSVSFGVFWMRAAFRSVPGGILESAMLDGAGPVRILRSIMLPLSAPALITLGLLTFMWTWNDYFLAFVLVNNPDQLPVTVALGSFSNKYTTQYNLMSAAALLVALPIVILYIVFQRRFIEGVLSGAVKG